MSDASIEHRIGTPTRRTHQTPLLLLHGAWHGAWCWNLWIDALAARGHEVHAISMRPSKSSRSKVMRGCATADSRAPMSRIPKTPLNSLSNLQPVGRFDKPHVFPPGSGIDTLKLKPDGTLHYHFAWFSGGCSGLDLVYSESSHPLLGNGRWAPLKRLP